ncbi:MAG: hypothetical protein JNM08_08210, partial [Rubrivivax sp.]|nr:hypothetical protein [Rubrivivax sp.]
MDAAAPAPRPARRWPLWLGLAVAGVLLGLASAWWAVTRAAQLGDAAGPWRVSLLAGS